MAYSGQIYYNDQPITIQQAVDLDLIYVDSDNNIWLKQDPMKIVTIQGDLRLTGN
jgi:hypothetical protein